MLPHPPSPYPDHGSKSDRSSVSTATSVSLQTYRSEGPWHFATGRCHREARYHMKINLPVFKDEDTKDAVTYQSWRWDLTVYHHAGCQDHTLLPYAIQSLQGYPGELVRSSRTDNVLTILDEHYNSVKALDTLNKELFQLWMGEKETALDWGVCLWRHLQVLAASFPECFPPDHVAELKYDYFYGGLPKWLKGPTWRPAHTGRCTPTTCKLWGKPKRRTPWNPLKAKPLTLQQNPRQPVSAPWGS